jgi:MoaA/NifB/PqqE/SkfB family radical SAM enzyme
VLFVDRVKQECEGEERLPRHAVRQPQPPGDRGADRVLRQHAGAARRGDRRDREIDEYFDLLLREELGFWCDEPAAFPPIARDWESPQRITNAILDVDRDSARDYPAILAQLDDLECEALQVRRYNPLGVSYGNVRDVSLHSAVARRDFRELWEINKDQIEVCKDCEFCYVCIDCRAYLSRPEDRYAKPAKRGYDPYTAQRR